MTRKYPRTPCLGNCSFGTWPGCVLWFWLVLTGAGCDQDKNPPKKSAPAPASQTAPAAPALPKRAWFEGSWSGKTQAHPAPETGAAVTTSASASECTLQVDIDATRVARGSGTCSGDRFVLSGVLSEGESPEAREALRLTLSSVEVIGTWVGADQTDPSHHTLSGTLRFSRLKDRENGTDVAPFLAQLTLQKEPLDGKTPAR